MNKKGFTLVELLAVIVILAIILAIAVPTISSLINNARLDAYKNQQTLMKKAATTYLASNTQLNPTTVGGSTFIKLSDLISNNYITSIVDPKDKSTCDTTYSGVKVTLNSDSSYTYEPYLNCTNYKGDDMAPIVSTKISGTSLTVRGSDENILSFDGINDYVTVVSSYPENLTIEAWGYGINIPSRMLWSFKNSSLAGPDLMMSYSGGKVYLNTGDSYSNPFSTSVHPTTNEWHHFAVVFNKTSNQATLYIDGIDNGTATYKNPSGTQLYIGTWYNISNSWQGYIKDVRVWSALRNSSEIINNMYTTLIGNESGLISFYKMNEGDGTTVFDYSASNIGGTINGATWLRNSGIKETRIKQGTTLIASSTQSTYTLTLAAGSYTVEVEDYVGRITTKQVTI